MRSFYRIELAPAVYAVANLDQPGVSFPGWTIVRVNVPRSYRGQGHGTRILQMVLDAADQEGVALYLGIYPSGPLDYDQLMYWYARHGFLPADRLGAMWRPAKVLANEPEGRS